MPTAKSRFVKRKLPITQTLAWFNERGRFIATVQDAPTLKALRKLLCTACKGAGVVGGGHLPLVACHCQKISPETHTLGVPEILEEMASTFRTRNAQYGDNWRMVGKIMAVLFPDGVHLRSAQDYDVWHLFELKIVKLTRFAVGKLEHIDSIHDDAVYSAMIEGILKERQAKQ